MGEKVQQLLLRVFGDRIDLPPEITRMAAEAMGRLFLQMHRVENPNEPVRQARREADDDETRS
jgi:hypothetical protein